LKKVKRVFKLIKGKSEKESLWKDFEQEAMPFSADLFRVAMFLKRDRDAAEDLVQETFVQALKSFHRYEQGTNCKAWLTTIMYHTHYKQLRKQINLHLVADTEEKIAGTVAFEAPIPQQITDEDVLQALGKVPQNFKEIVVLCDVEGFAYKEIASFLDVPIGTVMSRLHRGRKILRGELAVFARHYGIKTEATDKVKYKEGKSL